MSPISSIAIIGAGNGGCAAAADLASRDYRIRLYNRSPGRLAPIAERGGLERVGALGEGFAELELATNELGEAVTDVDLVMLTVPISSHPFYAKELASLLAPGQIVMLNPGHMGGGLFTAHEIHRLTGRNDIRTCETATLTYACRMKEPTVVNIMSTMSDLPFAAFPGRFQDELYEMINPLYDDLVPVSHVLESGFMDINAVEHPPQIICNAGWLEHTKGDYLFYYEGTTPSVGRVIDAVDEERMRIAAAADIPTKSFVEIFHQMGYTSSRAISEGSAHIALQDSEPNRWVKGPPSLDHRYIHEDVGWGLVPWSELGRAFGVSTPTMDALIVLGGVLNGRDYRSDGLTLDRIGLEGKASKDLKKYLFEGIPGG